MAVSRVLRLNSLLKEVLSEVIHKDLHHVPLINEFVTITRVEITADLDHAKVYISVIGKAKDKRDAISLLESMAGNIARRASKKIRIYRFPKIVFMIDEDLEHQLHIEDVITKLSRERESRKVSEE